MFRVLFVFFFKQKTAYEMRISDWSSDVCSSDLTGVDRPIRFTRETLSLSIAAPVESEAPPIAPIAPELAVLTPSVNDCSSRVSCPTPNQRMQRPGISVIREKDSSAERRVGNWGVRSCGYRWSPYH